MKTRLAITAIIIGLLNGCVNGLDKNPAQLHSHFTQRVGIYDSRAIAIAYCGSALHEREIQKLKETFEDARKKNDAAAIAQCEAAGKESQKRLHRQGFSTASVGDILAKIPEHVGDIQKKENVVALISKWDEDILAKHKNAEFIDVTDLLIQAFQPNERQLRYAADIQKQDPVPLDQIDEFIEKERNQ